MIVTTTDSVEGRRISEYIGIVSGEAINGINFLKDFGAGIRNIVGGRSKGYEKEIIKAGEDSIKEIIDRAEKMGADAIVGSKVDYEVLADSMLMVTISGTAVKLD
ncbi:MAG: YbjQ family protein [Finegoldia sp.]|nr:YbjQ family protein [Finegoldia sp.]